jgi:hypothetical protein
MRTSNDRISQNFVNLFQPTTHNLKASLHQETMQLFKQRPQDLATAEQYLHLADELHLMLTTAIDQLSNVLENSSKPGATRKLGPWWERHDNLPNFQILCQLVKDPNKADEFTLTINIIDHGPKKRPGPQSAMKLSIPLTNYHELKQFRDKLKQISRSDFNRIKQFIAKMAPEYCKQARNPQHEQWFKKVLAVFSILAIASLCTACVVLNPIGADIAVVSLFLLAYVFLIVFVYNLSDDNLVAALRNKIGYWFTNPTKAYRQSIEGQLSDLFNLTPVTERLRRLKLDITQQELELGLRQSWHNPNRKDFTINSQHGKSYRVQVIDIISQTTLAEYMQDELRLWQAGKKSEQDIPSVLIYYLPPLGTNPENTGQFKIAIGDAAINSFRQNGDFETRRPYTLHQEIYIYSGSEMLSLLMDEAECAQEHNVKISIS